MKIYLITHAHTAQMADVAMDAWRLSPRGIEQAAKLAEAPFWEEVDRVIVSAEPKTWLSVANVVTQRGLPVWVDSRFDELRRSGWITDYGLQVAAVFAQPSRSIAGWEAADSVCWRVRRGLADLQRRFAGETLALVGHGICLSLLRADVLGLAHVEFSAWQRLSFGSFAAINLDPPNLVADFVISSDPQR